MLAEKSFPRTLSGRHSTLDTTWRCMAKLPRAPLDRWIACLWELDGVCPPAHERELPRGEISVIVSLAGRHALVEAGGERTFGQAWVSGLQERAFVTASGGRAWLCGARLTKEGAYRLLRVPAHLLANRLVELDAVLGRAVTRLVESIHEAGSADQRLLLLGEFLLERMLQPCRWNRTVGWALARIERSRGDIRVSALARELACSEKHLHRRFVEHAGVGPRSVARLARFHAAIRALGDDRGSGPFGNPDDSSAAVEGRLVDLAHELGYYDQAHLARDFRAIGGLTPTAYLRSRVHSLDYGFARVERSDSSKTA